MRLSLILCAALIATPPALADTAQADAQQQAEEIADIIRDYNDALGDVVQGELTPAQIDQFEQIITPALNVDTQHQSLCGMLGFNAVQRAGIALSSAQMAAEMAAELTPGSMSDRLYQLTAQLVLGLGFERSVQAASHECLQHPIINAMFADVAMNSEQMRIEERCFLEDICP